VRSLSFERIANHATEAGLLCALSYGFTALGFAATRLIRRGDRFTPGRSSSGTPNGSRKRPGIMLVVLPLVLLGAVGLMLYSELIPRILAQPEDRSELLRGTGVKYTLVLAFVALPVVWISASGGRPRWRTFIPVCALGLAALALFGGRAEIGISALATILAYIAWRRPTRRQVLTLASVVAVGLLIFSAAFFVVRSGRVYRDRDPSVLRAKTSLEAGVRNTLAPYDNLIAYLDTSGARWENRLGEMATVLWTGLLPRAWVGEPELDPAQVLFRTLYGSRIRAGIPFTLPGLLHYAWGIPAVVLGSLGFGVVLSLLYRGFLNRQGDPLIVAMYAYFLARLSILLWGVYVPSFLQLIQVEVLIGVVMGGARVLAGRQASTVRDTGVDAGETVPSG
jgi:hypothetical protein